MDCHCPPYDRHNWSCPLTPIYADTYYRIEPTPDIRRRNILKAKVVHWNATLWQRDQYQWKAIGAHGSTSPITSIGDEGGKLPVTVVIDENDELVAELDKVNSLDGNVRDLLGRVGYRV